MWLNSLGNQVQWVRKLVINLDGLCPSQCAAALADHRPAFEPRDNLIDFGPLVLAIWSHGMRIDVSVVQPKSGFFSATKNMHSSLHLITKDYECDTTGISTILRSLVDNRQELKKYGPQISALGIRRDGGGGVIRWGTTRCSDCCTPNIGGCDQCNSDVTVCSTSETPFTVQDGGPHLILQPLEEPRNFMTLPECIRHRIVELVIRDQTVKIDLENQTSFELGLPHVNKTMYANHWNEFLTLSFLELIMTSYDSRTTFLNFAALRRMLRKAFKPHGPRNHTHPARILLEEVMEMRFILRFKLEMPCSLKNVSMSILPFVMETSTAPGCRKIDIEILDRFDFRVNSHTVSLQQLRLTVVKELMAIVFVVSGDDSCPCPEIWIDGFGTVQKSQKLARPTDVKKNKAHSFTEKDRLYRATHLNSCSCSRYNDSFFPFEDSASETLRYLLWVLERKSTAGQPTVP